jgi:thymidylate synthase
MKIIFAKNVCRALPLTINYLLKEGRDEDSRAGQVLVSPTPMMIVTEHPDQRVLFSEVRDANPFFHAAEAIWMLAGRNDAKFLDRFIKDFSARYAEKDGTLHDAYGKRWRNAFGFDQLGAVVERLIVDPFDRQCVIQMWDCALDYHNDLVGSWHSRPCNTNVFLRLNAGKLDLTVCCRSNDMLWGCHGANAVHFSVLHEYLAARLAVPMGTMYQLSNNAHVYWEALKKLNLKDLGVELQDDRYEVGTTGVGPAPLFNFINKADKDIETFMSVMDADQITMAAPKYSNSWFEYTLENIMKAHAYFKAKNYEGAMEAAVNIGSPDWRIACTEWIERRIP